MYHAHVATAEFLMNFRTSQICLQGTESTMFPFQQETDSPHVSKFLLLLHSQLADFELHFELPTYGVEHIAGILGDVFLILHLMSLEL